MTDTQYLWGWVIYLGGALGCLLSLWLLARKWPIRVKRALMMTTAILLLLPGTLQIEQTEQTFLVPALLASIYDGLGLGADAFWRNGLFVLVAAGIALATGLLLPTRRKNRRIYGELLTADEPDPE